MSDTNESQQNIIAKWGFWDSVRYFAAHKFRKLANSIDHPRSEVLQLTDNFIAIHVLAALIRLDVPKLLSKNDLTTAELAKEINCDADRLGRLLRAAKVLSLLELQGEKWTPTRLIHTLAPEMRAGKETATAFSPLDMNILYLCSRSQSGVWARLDQVVLTGENAFRAVNGVGVWEWLEQHPDEGEVFASLTGAITSVDAKTIINQYPFPENEEVTICDVGGGPGNLIFEIIRQNVNSTGVLLDLPGIVERSQANLGDDTISQRMQFIGTDIFEKIDVDADIYLIKGVLHNWDDQRCIKLLSNIRQVANNNARVLVIEIDHNEKDFLGRSALTDLYVMTLCDQGRERSAAQLRQLLKDSGIRLTGFESNSHGLAVIEGAV